MKITVVIGQGGKIVGTAHHVRHGSPAVGDGGPVAGPGQSVHVIDLPSELETIKDAEELHRRLKPHIPSRS
jgi:hypothetical protein